MEDLRELLAYDDNSAGGLMAKELVKVQEDKCPKCINTIRKQAQDVTRVHSIYVVDKTASKDACPSKIDYSKQQSHSKRYLHPQSRLCYRGYPRGRGGKNHV